VGEPALVSFVVDGVIANFLLKKSPRGPPPAPQPLWRGGKEEGDTARGRGRGGEKRGGEVRVWEEKGVNSMTTHIGECRVA